jgi:type VI secretion system protein ImpH
MHAKKRRFEPAVIDQLFHEPYRFECFQAVQLLELWLKRHGIPQQGAVANYLRFHNSTSLSFPASQVEAIGTEPRGLDRGSRTLGAELESGSLKYIRITPAFMGLLGGTGALPAHYTERIAEYVQSQQDEGPRAFLDAFSNRSLALFYEAWRKYRLELHYHVDGNDTFLPLLLGLAGLGYRSLQKRVARQEDGDVLDESIGYFAASIRHRPVSAVQMSRVLSEYFRQPVRVEQFIGCWYDVPTAQRTMVGSGNCVLGAGAMAGARVWQRDLRLRLVIGPLDYAGFAAFLPGGPAARALKSMLAMFTGVSLEYEVQLVLRAEDVHAMSLAGERDGGRLGWDTFVVTGPQTQDRNDVRYQIFATQ